MSKLKPVILAIVVIIAAPCLLCLLLAVPNMTHLRPIITWNEEKKLESYKEVWGESNVVNYRIRVQESHAFTAWIVEIEVRDGNARLISSNCTKSYIPCRKSANRDPWNPYNYHIPALFSQVEGIIKSMDNVTEHFSIPLMSCETYSITYDDEFGYPKNISTGDTCKTDYSSTVEVVSFEPID